MIISAPILTRHDAGLAHMRRTATALAAHPDEASVISNESLEVHVVAIRTDLSDLKVDFRSAIARVENESKTAVSRIDEQFREVRQDTRELRADNKTLRDKIDPAYGSLSTKAETTHASVSAKIDVGYSSLDKKIETNTGELRADLKEIHIAIADLKAMQKAILWVLGGVSTAAAVLAVANTLHWI